MERCVLLQNHLLQHTSANTTWNRGRMTRVSQLDARDFIFSPDVLNPDGNEELVARPLHISDYERGYCDLLGQLSDIERMDKQTYESRFREWQQEKDLYYIVVIEDVSRNKIIAGATLFVEKKLLHAAGNCGHIEDVVVDESYRGKNLGKRVIEHLISIGQKIGCYKVILDCSEKNIPFYEKCGFKRKEVSMALYLRKPKL